MAIEITSIREKRRLPRIRRDALRKAREQAARTRTLRRILHIAGAIFIIALCTGLVSFFYLYRSYSKLVDERLAHGYLTSRAGLYAAPRTLRKGQGLTRERLAAALRRAGYIDSGEASSSVVWSGRFVEGENFIEIEPRRSAETGTTPEFDAVRVEFDRRGRVARVTDDGVELDSFTLEPEPLSQDASMKTSERPALSFEDLPPVLVKAILAIEDRRFFEHSGVNAAGVIRAALSWGDTGQDLKQGGSTITQQLVKNTYLTPERTIRRKVNEAVLATVIERRLSKQDILALYCNEIYLGQRGSVGVRGVEQAARLYFGKELKDLSLAEAATIAGMIQSPGRYAPDRNPERSRLRRNVVIASMLRDGSITQEEAEAASNEHVAVVPLDQKDATAPHFIDYVNRLVESNTDESSDDEGVGHLRVQTTIDLELQRLAEESVKNQLARLEKVFKGKRRPEAALVALDPHSGKVLAMVGGSSYTDSQLNRVTDARRQPGSVFKPIVYAAAIESGISPVSTALDAPREFTYDLRSTYKPANFGGGYSMRDVTLRTGLVRSLNVVTVDVAVRVGLSRVVSYAEKLGLPRPQAYPSLALGTAEATPLEVATAYAAFANGGARVRPTALASLEDADDTRPARVLVGEEKQALKPSTSYMITDMLSAVIDQGTARAARGSLKGVAVAGKTGTSRDGWFAGYTPNLVCVVWVGFDDGEQLGLTGAESALPAWVEFMRGALELRPELGGESFPMPAGVTTVEIDSETGMIASPSCRSRERIAVTHALAPAASCFMHQEHLGELASSDNPGETFDPALYAKAEVRTLNTSSEERNAQPARAPQPPPASTEVPDVEAISPAVRVERGKNGRPVLTNAPRVRTDEWRDGWNR